MDKISCINHFHSIIYFDANEKEKQILNEKLNETLKDFEKSLASKQKSITLHHDSLLH